MTDNEEEEQLMAPQYARTDDEQMSEVLYEDDKVKITNTGILLSAYWFPLGTKKFIPFKDIKNAEVRRKVSHFFMKAWGIAADFEVWWPMDFKKRFGDRNAIIVDTGSWPKVGFCPGYGNLADVEKVYAIIAERCHEHLFLPFCLSLRHRIVRCLTGHPCIVI